VLLKISVNYIKDDIKARKRLRYYLMDVLQAFVLNGLFPTLIVSEIPGERIASTESRTAIVPGKL
jgi:hypothetical protein